MTKTVITIIILSVAMMMMMMQPAQAQSVMLIAASELTLRTASSVDIQVCAGGVLSDQRDAAGAAVLAQLQYLLSRATAVYLVRMSTTPLGTVCWLFVYQAPSPAFAATAETLIAQQSGAGNLVVAFGGQQLQCTTDVVPWVGEVRVFNCAIIIIIVLLTRIHTHVFPNLKIGWPSTGVECIGARTYHVGRIDRRGAHAVHDSRMLLHCAFAPQG